MAKDYYEVLGVERGATADDIQRAYRRLVRRYHPDVSKEKNAQQRFTEIQEAYDLLSDEKKRAMYDRVGRAGAGSPHYTWTNVAGRSGVEPDEFASAFDAFFGGSSPFERGPRRPRPRVHRQELHVSFMTASRGGTERVRVGTDAGERAIDVKVPAGIDDGATLRVAMTDPPGEVLLTVRVGMHPLFRRAEDSPADLELTLPLSIAEATLGATVEVPTLDGPVSLTVPPGTASGRKLRLRGKGIHPHGGQPGDLLALVRIVPPDGGRLSEDQSRVLTDLAGPPPRDPGWGAG